MLLINSVQNDESVFHLSANRKLQSTEIQCVQKEKTKVFFVISSIYEDCCNSGSSDEI